MANQAFTLQQQTKQLINFKMGMSPQMIAQAKLLELPFLDLRAALEKNENPALEINFPEEDYSLEALEQEDEKYSLKEANYNSYEADSNSIQEYVEQIPEAKERLFDLLLAQIEESLLSQEDKELGELIVSSLDDYGFLPSPSECKTIFAKYETAKLKEIIDWVQHLEPIGCATYSSIDSLLVQARILGAPHPSFEMMITYDLELLSKHKFSLLAKKYKMEEAEIIECFHFLEDLEPHPGMGFASPDDPNVFIYPELEVRSNGKNHDLYFSQHQIPEVSLLSEYNEHESMKPFYAEAEGIKEILKLRKLLLEKIGQHLIIYQADFFEKGEAYLKPEYQKDLAEELRVSESTLSRILREKYIKTKWGTFSLQYFFATGIKGGASSNSLSKNAVKQRIKEIVGNVKTSTKLSDQKIADKLTEQGLEISRRTVAKYRKELEIASSYERR